MEKNLNNNLNEFIYSIDNLCSSKFLMLDSSISALLQAIANTECVYNVIAESMVNFDFENEWKNAATENSLILPEESLKKIAFIFCILSNIDDKNLDIVALLKHYFSDDEAITPYERFCKEIILEFKDEILNQLGMSYNSEQAEEIAEKSEQDITEVYQLLYNAVRLLNDKVMNANKIRLVGLSREDLVAIISSYELAIRNNHSEYFYAFATTIKSATRKARDLKKIVGDINMYSTIIIKRG